MTKIAMYKAFCITALVYGSGSWTLYLQASVIRHAATSRELKPTGPRCSHCAKLYTSDFRLRILELCTEHIKADKQVHADVYTAQTGDNVIKDDLVLTLIQKKLKSNAVLHRGYVLSEVPSLSTSTMTFQHQMDLIYNLYPQPDFVILLEMDSEDVLVEKTSLKFDPLTGSVYRKQDYDENFEKERQEHLNKALKQVKIQPEMTKQEFELIQKKLEMEKMRKLNKIGGDDDDDEKNVDDEDEKAVQSKENVEDSEKVEEEDEQNEEEEDEDDEEESSDEDEEAKLARKARISKRQLDKQLKAFYQRLTTGLSPAILNRLVKLPQNFPEKRSEILNLYDKELTPHLNFLNMQSLLKLKFVLDKIKILCFKTCNKIYLSKINKQHLFKLNALKSTSVLIKEVLERLKCFHARPVCLVQPFTYPLDKILLKEAQERDVKPDYEEVKEKYRVDDDLERESLSEEFNRNVEEEADDKVRPEKTETENIETPNQQFLSRTNSVVAAGSEELISEKEGSTEKQADENLNTTAQKAETSPIHKTTSPYDSSSSEDLELANEQKSQLNEEDLFDELPLTNLLAKGGGWRWRRSKWRHYCPVALLKGELIPGKIDYAVRSDYL
ncbi:hypothetical protein HELRODRAFT_178145 [Helobdella robusta]|uniref:Uncharacterized protein n=1 Tax=Helobdella robusta TaxID=6412 RepID=T1FCU1_HELRO|nr:hypothetical protein HELRODRAFT_178145 [Helobdella robusta]ESN97358.1 hypothetical protein HELRODRAFT_178145 [Helobdella robusta]